MLICNFLCNLPEARESLTILHFHRFQKSLRQVQDTSLFFPEHNRLVRAIAVYLDFPVPLQWPFPVVPVL